MLGINELGMRSLRSKMTITNLPIKGLAEMA